MINVIVNVARFVLNRTVDSKNFSYSRIPSGTVDDLAEKTVQQRITHVFWRVSIVSVVEPRFQIIKSPSAINIKRNYRKGRNPR